jgi:hypothetical protein
MAFMDFATVMVDTKSGSLFLLKPNKRWSPCNKAKNRCPNTTKGDHHENLCLWLWIGCEPGQKVETRTPQEASDQEKA